MHSRVNLEQFEKQNYISRGSRGMLPRNTVMVILALLDQFLWQILFCFFASNSESFTKYDRFCLQIFDLSMLKT